MNLTLEAALDRVHALPCWSGPVDPTPIGGGLTNRNFRVHDGGRRLVVRIGDDIPVHHIRRVQEIAAARAAAEAGISPPLIHAVPGAIVMEEIDGRTLGPADIADPAMLPRIVELVRRTHAEMTRRVRGPLAAFWVFHFLRDYAGQLRDAASPYAPQCDGFLAAADELEAAVQPVRLVFAHNDLLAANLIDDGRRLWLLDWEFGGLGDPLFDLANLASNNGLSEAAEAAMVSAYVGGEPDGALFRRYAALRAASLLREAMWSMVSALHSTIDFDYAAYAEENLARYRQALGAFRRIGVSAAGGGHTQP